MGKFDDILGPDKKDIEIENPGRKSGRPKFTEKGVNQRIFEAYEKSKKKWAEEESVGC